MLIGAGLSLPSPNRGWNVKLSFLLRLYIRMECEVVCFVKAVYLGEV